MGGIQFIFRDRTTRCRCEGKSARWILCYSPKTRQPTWTLWSLNSKANSQLDVVCILRSIIQCSQLRASWYVCVISPNAKVLSLFWELRLVCECSWVTHHIISHNLKVVRRNSNDDEFIGFTVRQCRTSIDEMQHDLALSIQPSSDSHNTQFFHFRSWSLSAMNYGISQECHYLMSHSASLLSRRPRELSTLPDSYIKKHSQAGKPQNE